MRPRNAGLIIFGLVFFLFWNGEYDRYQSFKRIDSAPAYATARLDGVSRVEESKSRRRGFLRSLLRDESDQPPRVSFILKYKFTVQGRDYFYTTSAQDQQDALEFMARGPLEIVYSANDPDQHTLKRHFRPGQSGKEFFQHTVIAALVAGVAGLSVGLLLLLTRKLRTWTARKTVEIEETRAKARELPPPPPEVAAEVAREAALMRAIAEKKKTDPLAGAKMGAVELNQQLLKTFKDEKGVHIESLLCALGALAGYACQASLRAEALIKGESVNAPFTLVKDTAGRTYYFGDALNQRLAEGRLSIWNITTSGLRKAGQPLPDITGIFAHVAASVGGEQFGVPRWPEGHAASDLPVNFLKTLWPVVLPRVRKFAARPEEWPVLFGCALLEMVNKAKDVMPPELALTLVMESAIPMSRVDLPAIQRQQ
jgi:hypothetical protein